MSQKALIDVSCDLNGFFDQVVRAAVRSQGCSASNATLFYVVTLLADYARPDGLNREVLRQPLTVLMQQALQSQGAERFERLRSLGDSVLYVSGFFGDHLASRGVEPRFVAVLGSRAYDEAAAILRSAGTVSGPDVLGELSSKFDRFVRVIAAVADAVQAMAARGPEDILEIYERWLRTGSVSLAEALAAWGVTPVRGDATLH